MLPEPEVRKARRGLGNKPSCKGKPGSVDTETLHEYCGEAIEELAEELFPGGVIRGNSMHFGGSDGRKPRNSGSLTLTLAGDGVGLWFDHATAEGGDFISLVMSVHNVEFLDAIKLIEDAAGESFRVPEPEPEAEEIGAEPETEKPFDTFGYAYALASDSFYQTKEGKKRIVTEREIGLTLAGKGYQSDKINTFFVEVLETAKEEEEKRAKEKEYVSKNLLRLSEEMIDRSAILLGNRFLGRGQLTSDELNASVEDATLTVRQFIELAVLQADQIAKLTERVDQLEQWRLWSPADRDHLETPHTIE
jgi:hypothetical protein